MTYDHTSLQAFAKKLHSVKFISLELYESLLEGERDKDKEREEYIYYLIKTIFFL